MTCTDRAAGGGGPCTESTKGSGLVLMGGTLCLHEAACLPPTYQPSLTSQRLVRKTKTSPVACLVASCLARIRCAPNCSPSSRTSFACRREAKNQSINQSGMSSEVQAPVTPQPQHSRSTVIAQSQHSHITVTAQSQHSHRRWIRHAITGASATQHTSSTSTE